MKELNVLVYPHAMEVGGSQLNAIELAGAVRDRGHRVAVIADDGPLVDLVHALGLEHIAVPPRRLRPSPVVAAQLRALIRRRGVDIVHGYEWPPGLEATAAVYPHARAAAVCTINSMAIAPFLPDFIPLTVSTQALQRHTAPRRTGPVHLIEPPVDVVLNAPGHPTDEFRERYGLTGDPADGGQRPLLLAVVCRLVPELKLEGVLTAIEVVGRLARERPVQLVVVGDGSARQTVEEHARRANAVANRTAVVVTGELRDPRPAYAAADVMLGMGSSALRALAFGRPLVVQGERGFWELLTPQSCPLFLEQGWYGIGDGTGGTERLEAALRAVLDDADLRESLGRYGRDLAVERFSVTRAAGLLEDIYRAALEPALAGGRLGRTTTDGLRSARGLVAYKLHRRYQRLRGTAPRDDFNAATLAQAAIRPAGADANAR